MKTVGQLLRQARTKKRKSLKKVAKETKITLKTLQALESDDFSHLPATPFVQGFIRNYAQAVKLDPGKALAVFRRDFTTTESGEIIPKGLAKPLNSPSTWGKKLMVTLFVVLVFGLFFGYATWQLRNYFSPPQLTITQPQPETVVKGPAVEVKGWVSADSSVWVNEQLAEKFPNGEFRVNITLLPGENILQVKAENRRGKTVEKKIVIEVIDK